LPGVYSNTLVFTAVPNYVPEPTVVSVSPNPARPGATITITGTNFYGTGVSSAVTSVTIGGVSCTSFSVISNTSLTCVLPNLTDGTHQIVVTTNMGVSNNDVTITLDAPTMQDFSTATCTAMPVYPAVGSEVDLMDARDMKVYKIRKLADNKCWMVDNLALQPTGTSMVLDNITSDLASGTYTLLAANVLDPNTAAGQTYCANLNAVTFPHKCGRQYSWSVSTAGSTITTGDAPNSICPKNWRLPTGYANIVSRSGEFGNLANALNFGTDANASVANAIGSPWRGIAAGNDLSVQSTHIILWGSGAASSANAYLLAYYIGAGSPPSNADKTRAQPLRCVAR